MRRASVFLSLATAGVFLSFVSNVQPQVLGMGSLLRLASGSTIDLWYFTVDTEGSIRFDTKSWERDASGVDFDVNGDGEIAYLNTKIILFVDDGALDLTDEIASNDESILTFNDGSISKHDAFLSKNLTMGNYLLAIGATGMTAADVLNGFHGSSFYPKGPNFTDSDHGDYQIVFTGDLSFTSIPTNASLTPEPSALAMLIIGLSALAIQLRHRGRVRKSK